MVEGSGHYRNLTQWCVLSCFSRVQLFVTLQTVALQAPLSMAFSRQEYWGGLPCPPPEDLPDPGMEPVSLMSLALTAGSLPLAPPGKPYTMVEAKQFLLIFFS